MERFVQEILEKHFPGQFQQIYTDSLLIQYLDKKSGAIHGTAKTRRSLANYYAIYSILNFYVDEFLVVLISIGNLMAMNIQNSSLFIEDCMGEVSFKTMR